MTKVSMYTLLFCVSFFLISCSALENLKPLNTSVILTIDTEMLAKEGHSLKDDYSKDIERVCIVLDKRLRKLNYSSCKVVQQGDTAILLKLTRPLDKRSREVLLSTDVLEFYLVRNAIYSSEYNRLLRDIDGLVKSKGDNRAISLASSIEDGTFPVSVKEKISEVLKKDYVKNWMMSSQFLWGKDTVVNRMGISQGGFHLHLLEREPVITSETIISAQGYHDSQYGSNAVRFNFSKVGAKEFARITNRYRGKQLAMVVNNMVYSAPRITAQITNGSATIVCDFTKDEAKDLAIVLSTGGISLPLKVVSVTEK